MANRRRSTRKTDEPTTTATTTTTREAINRTVCTGTRTEIERLSVSRMFRNFGEISADGLAHDHTYTHAPTTDKNALTHTHTHADAHGHWHLGTNHWTADSGGDSTMITRLCAFTTHARPKSCLRVSSAWETCAQPRLVRIRLLARVYVF